MSRTPNSQYNESVATGRSGTARAVLLSDRLRNLPQYFLPQRLLTRLVHFFTRVQTTWFKNLLINSFIRLFNVDMSEAQESNANAYADFNQFFTRPLKLDSRPIATQNHIVCSPVDGTVSQAGIIANDGIFQAKGRDFSLTKLLGDDESDALIFKEGHFATLYLSPRDYHRIHMPMRGKLRAMTHIPGSLFSVSPLSTRVVPGLFARNERLVTIFDTKLGPMGLVLVGAINVASIETVWAGAITPPLGKRVCRWSYPDTGPQSIALDKGAEMGRFNMGSTVIMLFSKNTIVWDGAIRPEATVRMGSKLGIKQS